MCTPVIVRHFACESPAHMQAGLEAAVMFVPLMRHDLCRRPHRDVLVLPPRRHQSFQSLRVNLARQAKKLEEMKGVAVPAAKLKSKQRKETRLENSMKNDSAREFATLKLKQALAVRSNANLACLSGG